MSFVLTTTPCPEKREPIVFWAYYITSNTGRYLKFFQCHNLLEICNKSVIKFPTTPQTHRYTTLCPKYYWFPFFRTRCICTVYPTSYLCSIHITYGSLQNELASVRYVSLCSSEVLSFVTKQIYVK